MGFLLMWMRMLPRARPALKQLPARLQRQALLAQLARFAQVVATRKDLHSTSRLGLSREGPCGLYPGNAMPLLHV